MGYDKRFGYVNKIIEITGEIRVVAGYHSLYLVTPGEIEKLDGCFLYLDLQSAVLEGKEIVIKYAKTEKRWVEVPYALNSNAPGCEETEAQVRCEKRIPIP